MSISQNPLRRTSGLAVLALVGSLALAGCGGREEAGGSAAGDCDTGITDSSIKIGSSMPMSGAGAIYGAIARTNEAYWADVNAAGGVKMGDGKTRTVEYKAMDDAYDPARTVSNVRTLAEQDGIFALSGVLGTSPNLAIADYVAGERIPNLLTNTGTDEIMKQEGEFWTMGGLVQYDFEAKALADHIIAELPDAKVALLYQNDGFGKNMLANFEKHFEGTGVSLVATQSYEQSGGSADSQVVNLAKSGADVFISYATGTFMTQAIKKAHEVGWKPLTIVSSGTNHAEHVMKPAGPGAVGAMSITWLKDVTDPSWADDPGMQNWMAFAEKHTGDFEAVDSVAASAYNSAQILQAVLENMDGCTREDMLEAAQSLDSVETDLFLPGVTSSTTEDYPYFVTSLQLIEFDGQAWHGVGDVLTRE